MTITPEAILNEVDGLLDALSTNPAISDEDLVSIFADVSERAAKAARHIGAPMTHDQRRAMFASFNNVFGSDLKAGRKVFTRIVLGKPADAPVSWADCGDRNGQGALTQREASKVLDALSALEMTL